MDHEVNLIRTIRSFNRFYTDVIGLADRHLLNSSYSLAEARIIYEISQHKNIQASQIMELMRIDKSYLSRLLKKLEKEKVITRERSGKDARIVNLSLTNKGLKEFESLNKASDEQTGSLIGSLSALQKKRLVSDMVSLRSILQPAAANNIGPDAISIRTNLLPGDLGYITYLHGKVYHKECGYGLNFEGYVLESLGQFAHNYDAARDRVWICEHQNNIIGFLAGVHRERSVQLRYFILLPEYRGMGLGKKLMDSFMTYLQEQKLSKAYLWTTNEQHTATALYKRYGFRLTEEKPSIAFDKELIEQRFDLDLEAIVA